jgi:pre-60S factor REI1
MATVASTTTMAGPGASTHLYTCNTCQVAFRGGDLQRAHMQSDWHRYNLKRRVASLPPLTSEIFAEKVLANQATAAATAARAAFEKVCAACQRTYFSQNAYQNHIGSQKHKMRVAQLQAVSVTTQDDDTESMMSSVVSLGDSVDTLPAKETDDGAEAEFSKVVDGLKETKIDDDVVRRPTRPHHSGDGEVRDPHPLSPTTTEDDTEEEEAETTKTDSVMPDTTITCLFCNSRAPSVEANVLHMQKKHGMFIPEKPYLVDLEGLIGWLSDRVHALHECLYCGLAKHTAHGIQTHMRDKGHCMIAFDHEEDMIEVGQFYDFRSSYSDGEEEESDDEDEIKVASGKLGAKRTEQMDVDDEDEEWEDEDGEVDGEEDDDMPDASVADSERTTTTSTRPRMDQAYLDDYELHLPSGRTAGHRSLARYFRQNLHSYPTAVERAQRLLTQGEEEEPARRGRGRDTQLASRGEGGLGLANAPEEKRKAAKKLELKEVKKAQRQQNKWEWGVNKQNNSQKYFRDPLLQ